MPSAPPGTETDTVEPGGKGAVASKDRVSGEVCTPEPGTAGTSDGTGVSGASGTVKRTLRLASDGSLVASGAGTLVTTERRPGDAVGAAPAFDGGTRVTTSAVEAAATAQSAAITAAINQ